MSIYSLSLDKPLVGTWKVMEGLEEDTEINQRKSTSVRLSGTHLFRREIKCKNATKKNKVQMMESFLLKFFFQL